MRLTAILFFFLQVHKDAAICQPSLFLHLMCLPATLLPPDALVCQESVFLYLLLSISHPFFVLCCVLPARLFLQILLSVSHPSSSRCCWLPVSLLYSSRCCCLPAILPLPVTTVCRHPSFIRCCCTSSSSCQPYLFFSRWYPSHPRWHLQQCKAYWSILLHVQKPVNV